jgi:hypothetical protein
MQDPFTGRTTRICGRALPDASDRGGFQHDHERRLEALARLGAAATECGLSADSDRDLVLLAEDEVSLLETAGGNWTELGEAIRAWRALVPLRTLEEFGFNPDAENSIEEANSNLRRIGGGVEAWAFAAMADGSVYKFYLPREAKRIGSVFGFQLADDPAVQADAELGDYRGLLEKLFLIDALGGMPTEVIALTPEGVLVAKQALGDPLAQGEDVSGRLPSGLIEIPSRFLRANRDHPRLFFAAGRPWLVADLHARNFVRDEDGGLRVIDLVAAPWPAASLRHPLIASWLLRARENPACTLLPPLLDSEL